MPGYTPEALQETNLVEIERISEGLKGHMISPWKHVRGSNKEK